jgi:hypothetical protein
MVHGTLLARRLSSAAAFIRNSSIGCRAVAPKTDTSTISAVAALAAVTRFALPSRSTDSGVTRPGPANP